MQVSYCHRWNFRRSAPIDPLTEAGARGRDKAGELYTVVVGDPTAPEKIIEVVWQKDHVGVRFFDRLQRQSVAYSFTKTDDRRMFLEKISNWQYDDDAAKGLSESSRIEVITYRPDGVVRHEIRDKRANEVKRTDYRDVDLDINWEPVPTFGQWESIARYDREATRA